MRRVLLTLFLISVSGWSQAAQQPAQPPIVVQVQMPPANPWMRLVELVVSGIIGAGLALFGVWLTNKNNAAENEANRKHQFEVNSRQKRWEFRKGPAASTPDHDVAMPESFRHREPESRGTPEAARTDPSRQERESTGRGSCP
jgi:hypothetical protein